MTSKINFLDCTFRDGGYYNDWDFSPEVVDLYLNSMSSAGVDVVEMGFRSTRNTSFKGAFAYTTDDFLRSLNIPELLKVGVMVNASELVRQSKQLTEILEILFPNEAANSPVDLVRIACHVHEFEEALPASLWLKERGYAVGFNLMQVADLTADDIRKLAKIASEYPLDVLYFADSMGSMNPEKTNEIVSWLRAEWDGALGVHTHNNLGLALSNTLQAISTGCTWVDSTVTGMGRGPGNAKTEELAIELSEMSQNSINLIPLMSLIRQHFKPMQQAFGWGTNPYYYLAGKYSIHPTYIQEMLGDTRFDEEDLIAVIDYLRTKGGGKFDAGKLNAARQFYTGTPRGTWNPRSLFSGRETLLLGTGPGVQKHRVAIESYIASKRPLVVALNTQSEISAELIDLRVACHPVRLLADCDTHTKLPQPLITPYTMLPKEVKNSLSAKNILDYGLLVEPNTFRISEEWCTLPNSLVVAYALAIATSGNSTKILMAGFDGYGEDDPRNKEMNALLDIYQQLEDSIKLEAVTPTRYRVATSSIYAI